MDVYVDLAELIDMPAEIARTKQEMEKITGFIAAKEKKLGQRPTSLAVAAGRGGARKEWDSLQDLKDRQLAAASRGIGAAGRDEIAC